MNSGTTRQKHEGAKPVRLKRPAWWAVTVFLLVAVIAGPATADPLLEMVGAAVTPVPFSARIISTGTDSAFFNPTLMFDQQPGFRVGFFYMRHNLNIDYMDRPAGSDISADIYSSQPIDRTPSALDRIRPNATAALQNQRGSSSTIDNSYYMNISHTAQFIKDKLAFGVYMIIPTDSFQSKHAFFVDEREQAFSNSLGFELYGDRMRNYLFSMALAGKPAKWVSLGLGISLAMVTNTTSRVLQSTGTADQPIVNTDTNIHMSGVPYAAVSFDPIKGLRITTTFHWKFESPSTTKYEPQIWAKDAAGQTSVTQHTYDFMHSSDPMRLALGVSWTGQATPRLEYTVASSFQWARWSEYIDRQGDRPTKAWSDNFPVTAGVLFNIDDKHEVGLDMTFVKSPVPYQDGRTNYIDNDRFGIATGYGYSFKVKKKYVISFGASFQFQHLLPRTIKKSASATDPVIDEFPESISDVTGQLMQSSVGLQTNNPGYPGYTSSGWLICTGLYFRFQH